MGVQDGFPVNATYTNPRFISKNTSDNMPFPLAFSYAPSGTTVSDIQAATNRLYTATGATDAGATGTVYNATPSTITNGQNYQTALTVLAGKFDPASGHHHTGAPGDGPLIAAGVSSLAVNGFTPATGDIVLFNGNSVSMTQVGANITVGLSNAVVLGVSGTSAGSLGLAAASGGIFTQSANATTATYGVKWPGAQAGASGYALLNDGAGNLTWGQAGTASPLTTKGDLYGYDTGNTRVPVGTDGQDLIPDSNQTLGVRYADSVVKNFVRINADADVSIGNWATFADAAANIPVDGTGGSPSITWTRTTSVPLAGPGAFLFTKSGSANRQGQGASISFSMDPACQGQVIAVTFDYKIVSGTFTASNGITPPLNDGTTTTNAGNSDLEVFMYDVTNSVLIPLTPQVLVSNSSVSGQFKAVFQASINSTSYRLIVFQATNTTNNYTAQFDNFFVGRQSVSYGYAGTDWTAYTPTFSAGWGTPSNISFKWRQLGDSTQVKGTLTTGILTAALGSISLPFGSLDTNKISINNTTSNPGQRCGFFEQTGGTQFAPIVTAPATSLTVVYVGNNTNTVNQLTPQNMDTPFGNNLVTSIDFIVPIAGWSSNVLMSNDAATRVVSMIADGTAATITASNPVIFPTVSQDTHASYNSTTGRYTVPVSGVYRLSFFVAATASNATIWNIYKNGSIADGIGFSVGDRSVGSGKVICVAGDIIDIRPAANVTSTGTGQMTIEQIQGPAAIAATENVFLQYTGNAGTSLTANVTNIDFSTKVVDSHNAWSGTIFTAPRSGLYLIQCMTVITVAGQVFLSTYVNTVQKLTLNQATAIGQVTGGSTAQYLNAGDTVSIRMDTSKVLSNSAQSHWITIASQ